MPEASFQKFTHRPLNRSLVGTARFAASLASDYLTSLAAAPRCRDSWQHVERYCVFVGYPSSGHSLFGALLDSHRHVMLSHELDALKYVRAHFSRTELYALIMERSKVFIASGGIWNNYDYLVPGQWQGRFEKLRVIGDKKGGLTALQVREDPGLLNRLQSLVKVPLAFIHMTRNPYDVIATRLKRRREGMDLAWYADRFFEHADGVKIAREFAGPERCFDVRHEDVVADTRAKVAEACAFLGVDAPADYLDACAAKVFESPKRTRATAPWTDELLAHVQHRIAEYPFLQGYTYET
jgi:hypothetical protein